MRSRLALVYDLKRTKHDIQIVVVAGQVEGTDLNQSVHAMVLEINGKGFTSTIYNEQNRMGILCYYFVAPFLVPTFTEKTTYRQYRMVHTVLDGFVEATLEAVCHFNKAIAGACIL